MCISAGCHDTEATAPFTVKQDVCRLSYATSINTHLVAVVAAAAAGAAAAAAASAVAAAAAAVAAAAAAAAAAAGAAVVMGINQGGRGNHNNPSLIG